MVFFQDPKKGQDNTQKEKNVYFLSGCVLRRRLSKGAVGFLKKNLKMSPFFLAIFGILLENATILKNSNNGVNL